MDKPESKTLGATVPEAYSKAVTRLVNMGKYISESDFVRQAIKEKLEREGVKIGEEV